MKIQNSKCNLAILCLLIFSAIPQLFVYNQGYYYNSTTPTILKYLINSSCFSGVSLMGYWYLKQEKSNSLYKIWALYYLLTGSVIVFYYTYKYFSKSFYAPTYLAVMSIFEVSVSPMPFIIAWLLLKLAGSFQNKDASI